MPKINPIKLKYFENRLICKKIIYGNGYYNQYPNYGNIRSIKSDFLTLNCTCPQGQKTCGTIGTNSCEQASCMPNNEKCPINNLQVVQYSAKIR
jgi:hypothetical protein